MGWRLTAEQPTKEPSPKSEEGSSQDKPTPRQEPTVGAQLEINHLLKKEPLDHLIEPAVHGGSPSPDQAARPTTASAVQQELVNPGNQARTNAKCRLATAE